MRFEIKGQRDSELHIPDKLFSFFFVSILVLNLTNTAEITDTEVKYLLTHQKHNPKIDVMSSLQFTNIYLFYV